MKPCDAHPVASQGIVHFTTVRLAEVITAIDPRREHELVYRAVTLGRKLGRKNWPGRTIKDLVGTLFGWRPPAPRGNRGGIDNMFHQLLGQKRRVELSAYIPKGTGCGKEAPATGHLRRIGSLLRFVGSTSRTALTEDSANL